MLSCARPMTIPLGQILYACAERQAGKYRVLLRGTVGGCHAGADSLRTMARGQAEPRADRAAVVRPRPDGARPGFRREAHSLDGDPRGARTGEEGGARRP